MGVRRSLGRPTAEDLAGLDLVKGRHSGWGYSRTLPHPLWGACWACTDPWSRDRPIPVDRIRTNGVRGFIERFLI